MPPLVSLQRVGVRRGSTPILRDLDLTIEPGEIVGLFGANGSGKTTLVRLIATLIRPTDGTGTVLGVPIGTVAVDEVRPRIGLAGHEPALAGRMTLRENLRLVADLRGLPHGEVDTALATAGLEAAADRRVDDCSNGMRRRADLARVAMTRPTLALLDEAHVGLDSSALPLLRHVTEGVLSRGGAALVIAHDRNAVAGLTDRSLELRDGSLQEVRG